MGVANDVDTLWVVPGALRSPLLSTSIGFVYAIAASPDSVRP